MTAQGKLEALRLEDVRRAHVGEVVETGNRQHTWVVD